jgi:hypothetical protein
MPDNYAVQNPVCDVDFTAALGARRRSCDRVLHCISTISLSSVANRFGLTSTILHRDFPRHHGAIDYYYYFCFNRCHMYTFSHFLYNSLELNRSNDMSLFRHSRLSSSSSVASVSAFCFLSCSSFSSCYFS